MLNSLDLLVIVSLALAVASLLALSLMFLAKNRRVKKVNFYIVVALGLYICSISLRMFWPMFFLQSVVGAAFGVMSLASLALERMSKNDEKKFRLARLLAAAALVLGILNALY